jgi:hypothetical protein
VDSLSWRWIALMLLAPLPVGALLAAPLWRRTEMILGNIVGAAVIFGTAVALVMREGVELDRVTAGCLESGVVCWPEPSAFARYAIYAFIALFEVIVLFALSLIVEARMRNRRYAPEWRS